MLGGYDENTCSVCGFYEKTNYTPIVSHSYETTYSHNSSFHWRDCKHCDATTAYGEHTIDTSGFCSVCNQPFAPTEGLIYELSADGTYAEVIDYSGAATRVAIADTYKGVPVTHIYSRAFYDKDIITTIVIPDSVTVIGNSAFCGCDNLTDITIPVSVTAIDSEAFFACGNLTNVYLSDIAKWCAVSFGYGDANPFSWAKNLYLNGELVTELIIPGGVTAIGERAFYCFSGFTGVTIPDSVVSIGACAFYNCKNLTSVTIPDSVAFVGGSAFYGCTKLSSATIQGSETKIGSYAFSNCNSALYTEYENGRYVGIGNNPYAILCEIIDKKLITYMVHTDTRIIEDSAFMGCNRLHNITIPRGLIAIGSSAFYDCFNLKAVNFCGTEEEWVAIEKGHEWNQGCSFNIVYNYSGS